MSESLEVWLDADFLSERILVGKLAHDRGAIRFVYEPTWLKHPLSFALDPDLTLGGGTFYPRPEQGKPCASQAWRAFSSSLLLPLPATPTRALRSPAPTK